MTHDEKVLALLWDRQPHSHHEVYGLHVVGHSRIASLRGKGYGIEQWREGDTYWYVLTATPSEVAQNAGLTAKQSPVPAASLGVDVTAGTRESAAEQAAPVFVEGQLSIDDALVAA